MKLGQATMMLAIVVATAFTGVSVAYAARAIATDNTNVRAGPSTDYRVVGRMVRGERLFVRRCNRPGTWCLVDRNRGRDGWVRSRSLTHRGGGSYRPWDGSSRPGGGFDVCFFGANGRICLGR